MITVTKPYLPDLGKYQKYISDIYDRQWLTNDGPLLRELTDRLKDHLGVRNMLLVSNGTLALQVAFRALELRGSVVTTPFTFAATSSALEWEGIVPLYADIDPVSMNISPGLIAGALRADTSAICPVHVYGTPCDVTEIDAVARTHGLKVVYDAAHAFGVSLDDGTNVLQFGDASTLSFHATKVFHTVEGGAIIFRDADALEAAARMINFGLPATPDGRIPAPGINAKLSEVHAAMGLCVLDDISNIIAARLERVALYRKGLQDCADILLTQGTFQANGGYMPIILGSSSERDEVSEHLAAHGIMTRRYFWPSLDLGYGASIGTEARNSADIASRVICLPLYADLAKDDIARICMFTVQALARRPAG